MKAFKKKRQEQKLKTKLCFIPHFIVSGPEELPSTNLTNQMYSPRKVKSLAFLAATKHTEIMEFSQQLERGRKRRDTQRQSKRVGVSQHGDQGEMFDDSFLCVSRSGKSIKYSI